MSLGLHKTYVTALAATPGASLIAAVTGAKIRINKIRIALTDAADVVLTDGSGGTEILRVAVEADKASLEVTPVNCIGTAATAVFVFTSAGTPTPTIDIEYDTIPSP